MCDHSFNSQFLSLLRWAATTSFVVVFCCSRLQSAAFGLLSNRTSALLKHLCCFSCKWQSQLSCLSARLKWGSSSRELRSMYLFLCPVLPLQLPWSNRPKETQIMRVHRCKIPVVRFYVFPEVQSVFVLDMIQALWLQFMYLCNPPQFLVIPRIQANVFAYLVDMAELSRYF